MHEAATFSAHWSSVLKQGFWLEAKVLRAQQSWQKGWNWLSPPLSRDQEVSQGSDQGQLLRLGVLQPKAKQVSASVAPLRKSPHLLNLLLVTLLIKGPIGIFLRSEN